MSKMSPLFARQPIFDSKINTVAYELLFRGSYDNSATFIDGDQASSHVLFYAFGQNRIEEVIGQVPAYINFTPQLLVHPPPLPPEKLVIEILETVKPDKWVIEGIKTLKELGYKIALDDFFINKDTKILLNYADIIKIDVLNLEHEKLEKYVKYLKPMGMTLLAEKIENHAVFQQCCNLGFELFQGYFLAKPQIIEGIKVSESKQAILRLLATIMASNVEMSAIVTAIAADPRLSYRILRIINSTACHVPCEIHSLNQAVTMLGLTQIRNWAAFLLMTGDNEKPLELSIMSMTRAKFCEQIGNQLGGKKLGESSFTAGLLSTFDAFLDMPLPDLLEHLSLTLEMSEGILSNQGDIGKILSLAMNYEKAAWDTIKKNPLIGPNRLNEDQLNNHYLSSLQWAKQTIDAK